MAVGTARLPCALISIKIWTVDVSQPVLTHILEAMPAMPSSWEEQYAEAHKKKESDITVAPGLKNILGFYNLQFKLAKDLSKQHTFNLVDTSSWVFSV